MLCTCTINRFVLFTEHHILCGYFKENLHIDKLAGAERVKYLLEDTLYMAN